MVQALAMHPLGVPHVERTGLPLVLQAAALVLLVGLVLWGIGDLTGWRWQSLRRRPSSRFPRQSWLAADRFLAAEPDERLVADRQPSPPHPPRRHRPVYAVGVVSDRWLARLTSSLGIGNARRPITLRHLRIDPLATRSLPPTRGDNLLIVVDGEVIASVGDEMGIARRESNIVADLRPGARAALGPGDALVCPAAATPPLWSGRTGASVAVVDLGTRTGRFLPGRLLLALFAAAVAYAALPNMRFLEVSADFMTTDDTRRLALLGELFTILVAAGAALVVAAPRGAALCFLGAVAAGAALAVYPYLPNRVVYSTWPSAVVWASLPLALALAAIGVRRWEDRARSRSRGSSAVTDSESDAAAISWSLHDG